VDSVLSVIVLLALVDVGGEVVVANLVRQRLRVVVDLPAHHTGRPAAPPRSVRSLLFWYSTGALIQAGSIVAVVYACLASLSGFGPHVEPLPAGRPLLITAIVAVVLLLITVPGAVLVAASLRRERPEGWRYVVGTGRFGPVVSAIIAVIVVGACLVLTVPEPVQRTVVGFYLVNLMWAVPYQRAFLHLDTWLWFGPPAHRVDDKVSER
jgi:hypothetical protein